MEVPNPRYNRRQLVVPVLLVYCIAMTTKCNDIIILPTTPDLQSSASVQYGSTVMDDSL